ncbi:MAG: transglutaminase domain-containing protein [Oscillospiraceae bacterium]|nr:transglutaminase domain-containing protein [Oscillospiraceae bacterium]
MKKFFKTAAALATATCCLLNCGVMTGFAESISADSFESSEEILYGEMSDYSLTLPKMPEIHSNYSESSYNYCDGLNSNNRAVYDALSVWTSPSEDAVTVTLPEPVVVTLSALPGSSAYTEEDEEKFSAALFSTCKSGIDCLLFDMPEICWLDPSKLAIGVKEATSSYNWRSGTYTLTIKSMKFTPALLSAFGSLENAELYCDKLSQAVEEFTGLTGSRYEILETVHDEIALNTYYDVNSTYSSTALGALVEPGVVCEGYSKAFKLICDRLDIPCVVVFGNYDVTENVAHMWNDVLMEDGNWYAVDVTWDDNDGDGSEYDHDYFLKGSKSFYKLHTECEDFLGTTVIYPEITAEDYEPGKQTATTTSTATTTESTTTTTTTVTETTASETENTTTSTEAAETTTQEETTTAATETTTVRTTTTTETTTTRNETTTAETTLTTREETTTAETTTTTREETTTAETNTTTREETTTAATTTRATTTASETTTSAKTTAVETTAATTTTSEGPELKGDFNGDGVINVVDLVLCAQAVSGKDTGFSCDYDGDGITDVFDLIMIRKAVAKIVNA